MSRFLMRIVDKTTGNVVEYDPGSPIEAELVQSIADEVVARGVGILKTSAHVRQDVVDAVQTVVMQLKSRIRP